MKAELYLGDADRTNLNRLAALDNVDWGIADWPCPEMLQQVPSLEPAKLHICKPHTHRRQPNKLCVTNETNPEVVARVLQRLIQGLPTRDRQTDDLLLRNVSTFSTA